MLQWWRRRREARQQAHKERVARLLKAYPNDDPMVVKAVLSNHPGVSLSAQRALSDAADRRYRESVTRRIVREELERMVKLQGARS